MVFSISNIPNQVKIVLSSTLIIMKATMTSIQSNESATEQIII